MRIDINLASQQYEDARQFYFRWGAALVLVVALTAGLALLAWYSFRSTSADRRQINDLHQRISRLDDERKHAEEVLNRPENRDVRDQSRFWNDVIDQKSFSWTQLLADLEKIMPPRAYVASVQPSVTADRRLQLKLTIAGEKREDVNDLLGKMERSERFHESRLESENFHPQGLASGSQFSGQASQPVWEFVIETTYTPATSQPRVAAKAGAP